MITCSFLIILGFLVFKVSSSQWASRNIGVLQFESDGASNSSLFSIEVSKSRFCRLDGFNVDISSRVLSSLQYKSYIGIMMEGSDSVLLKRLQFPELCRPVQNPRLSCQKPSEWCTPHIDSISVEKSTGLIVLNFIEDTNQPDMSTVESVLDILQFTPPLVGSIVGVWSSSKVLKMAVEEEYLRDILTAHNKGKMIEIAPRADVKVCSTDQDPPVLWKESSIRIESPGIHYILLLDENLKLISRVVPIHVLSCNDTLLSVKETLLNDVSFDDISLRDSSFFRQADKNVFIGGPLPVSGDHEILIPSDSCPGMNEGTWSLSFWIYLLEGWNNEHRTLFHKSTSHAGQSTLDRTPSAWMLPMSNRITMRGSSLSNPDIGAESILELPLGTWNLLTFTFLNLSQEEFMMDDDHDSDQILLNHFSDGGIGQTIGSKRKRWSKSEEERKFWSTFLKRDISSSTKYVMNFYVNGVLDAMLQFPMELVGNSGPLQLFHDISHKGPKSFISDVTIWNSVLSPTEIQTMSNHGPQALNAQELKESLLILSKNYMHQSNRIKKSISETFGLFEGFTRLFPAASVNEFSPMHQEIPFTLYLSPTETTHAKKISESQVSLSVVQDISNSLYEDGMKAWKNCDAIDIVMDLFSQSAMMGKIESLYSWSMLMAFENLGPSSSCGLVQTKNQAHRKRNQIIQNIFVSEISMMPGMNAEESHNQAWETSKEEHRKQKQRDILEWVNETEYFKIYDQFSVFSESKYFHQKKLIAEEVIKKLELLDDVSIAFLGFLVCSQLGHQESWVYLSIMLSNGFGNPAIQYLANLSAQERADLTLGLDIFRVIPMPWYVRDLHVFEPNSLFHEILSTLIANSKGKWDEVSLEFSPLGNSVHDYKKNEMNLTSLSATKWSMSLLFVASLLNVPEAQAILSTRYQRGWSTSVDIETSLIFAQWVHPFVNSEFHRVGGQPIAEKERLNELSANEVSKGQEGDDDEIIQAHMHQARMGQVPSMLTLGDWYYFGSHGLPRNQEQALSYYEQAASSGSADGKCGAAGMYLLGEGGVQNSSHAIELYESAASQGSVRALNGLGYIYFFGKTVPKNETKAYYYFLAAAEMEVDGDSLFNAGFCLEKGMGIPQNYSQAAKFYHIAARKFGHFDAIGCYGIMLAQGRGVHRNPHEALTFLSTTLQIGPWVGWIRRGFNLYLSKNYHHSLIVYALGGEYGYEVSLSNAAYLSRNQGLMSPLSSNSQSILPLFILRELLMACSITNLPPQHGWSLYFLGELYFHPQFPKFPYQYTSGLRYFLASSRTGNSMSSFVLGAMHHFGHLLPKNDIRAQYYYEKALDQSNPEVSLPGDLRWIALALNQLLIYESHLPSSFTRYLYWFALKLLPNLIAHHQ